MSDFYNKYPYTDFHELNLDWVIERVKKLTEDWLATQQEWNDTEEQWQQLHDYVMDYFANLDVQDEINNKINAMILDGSFATIVTPIVDSQISTTVSSWLADHITQPTTPAVDSSLTVSGAAADAQKTGRAIATVYSSSNTYYKGEYVLYNGTVYKCTSTISTPETWDGSHWTSTNAMNELVRTCFDSIESSGIFIDSAAKVSQYVSVDNFPINSIVLCNQYYGAQLTNAPFTNTAYIVISITHANVNDSLPNNGEAQIAIPFLATSNLGLKTRSYSGSWSSWIDFTKNNDYIGSSYVFINDAATAAAYGDCNTYPVNTVIACGGAYAMSITNRPFNQAFIVITTAYKYQATVPFGGEVQIGIGWGGNAGIYFRTHDGSSWGAWKTSAINPDYIASSKIFINSPSQLTAYPSCDTLPVNTIILANQYYGSQMTNAPYSDIAFIIITSAYNVGSAPVPYGGEFQIAIPFDASQNSIKIRNYGGLAWSEWCATDGPNIYHADNTNFISVIDKAVQSKDAIVYLASGTYTMFDSAHDDAYWNGRKYNSRHYGLQLKNGIKLIGQGDVTINALYTGSDPDMLENFTTFDINGDFEMHNIKLVNENTSYCVHDDQMNTSIATRGLYDNCSMTHNGSTHTFLYGGPICIGGGCSGTCTDRTISNCIFEAVGQSYSISYHTANAKYGTIVFTGNYCKEGSFRIWQYIGGSLRAIVSNNSLDIAISNADNLPLTEFNNEIRP